MTATDMGDTAVQVRRRYPEGGKRRTGFWQNRDRDSVLVWAGAHLAFLVLVLEVSAQRRQGIGQTLQQWDANLLQNIAAHGYFSGHSVPNNAAFFPGFPVALAAVNFVVRNWVLSEVLLSAISSLAATVFLGRLSRNRAALFLWCSPAAVFLCVGYTESLFLALAVPAWHCARNGRPGNAALLAGLAALVRVNGIFLILGILVMYLFQARRPHEYAAAFLRTAASLLYPFAYVLYLRLHTGSWDAWRAAERAGWGRTLTAPWKALQATWRAAFGGTAPAFASAFQLELFAMAVGVALVASLGWQSWSWRWNRWGEFAYCLTTLSVLATSTWYESVPRTLLLLFPLWQELGELDEERPAAGRAVLWVSSALAAFTAIAYFSGQWAG